MQIIRKQHIEDETNLLEQIKFRYLPYWPLFLTLIVVFLSAAWVYVKFQTPAYSIGAKLLIKDENKGSEDAKVLEELNVISPKKIVENEMEVIHSKPVLNKVVKDMKLYAPIFEKTSFGPRSAYLTSPVVIEAYFPDSIKSVEKAEFDFNPKNTSVVMNGTSYGLDKWYATPYGQLQFIRNPNLKETTSKTKFFFSLTQPKAVSNSISGNLKINAPNKLSSIVELTMTDEVRERGEKILNSIIDAYNSSLVTEKGDLAVNTLSFIDERLKTVKHDLDSIELLQQQFRSQRGAIDIGAQGQMILDNVSFNDKKLSEVNMQLSELGVVESYVQSRESGGRMVPSIAVNDPVLSQMVGNLYDLEVKYANEVKTAGEYNPSTVALGDQIAKMRPSIIENIRNQKRSLQASQNSISATNGGFNSMLRAIPATQRRLVEIEREQKVESGIYNYLLQKREEAALSQTSSNESNSRVVDRAEASEAPVSPKKKLVYLSALLLALFASTGVVMGKEKAGNKIMFRKDIEALTELPILGEIAAEDSKNPIVIDDRRKTVIAEQFRKLRATLSYIGVNQEHKRILVTSSISGEGKSFVATNLAISLAITGKKVVLLDFDLNNPSLNNKLNIKSQKGITDFLLDKEQNIDEIILKTDLHENLSLISTGKLPFNPSELLLNKNVEKLLNYLNEKFDYLVIDTAPVVPVTDAYLLSEYCDATLFIVRHNYSPKILVEMFDENNRLNNLKNAAIVFNGVKPRGFGRKSYSYGYGYTSGYQYSNGYIQKQTPKASIGNKK